MPPLEKGDSKCGGKGIFHFEMKLCFDNFIFLILCYCEIQILFIIFRVFRLQNISCFK